MEIPSEYEYVGRISIRENIAGELHSLGPCKTATASDAPELSGLEGLQQASHGVSFANVAEFPFFVLSEEGDTFARLRAREYRHQQEMLNAQAQLREAKASQ